MPKISALPVLFADYGTFKNGQKTRFLEIEQFWGWKKNMFQLGYHHQNLPAGSPWIVVAGIVLFIGIPSLNEQKETPENMKKPEKSDFWRFSGPSDDNCIADRGLKFRQNILPLVDNWVLKTKRLN